MTHLMRAWLLSILMGTTTLLAQQPFGRILGRVVDESGAVIPGTSVTVANVETAVVNSTVSNDRGRFEILNLIPGRYLIKSELSGFKHYQRGPIEVRVGDMLEFEIRLEVGEVTDNVTVTSEAPLLESSNASLGQVVDHQRIMNLPLPDDNPIYLMNLVAGVVSTTAPTGQWEPHNVDITTAIGADGAGGRRSEYTLDGNPNMWKGGRISYMPPPEMLQEFRVQTTPYDASLGNFTGAHVNMVMKSGTNAFHGTLYASYTGRPLTARDFFTNRSIYDTSTGPVTDEKIASFWPSVRTNRYRASADGPFILPKIYDGRGRTFWTYGVDVMDFITPEQTFLTVPTAKQRQGDFSELLALGTNYRIFDPATTRTAPNNRLSRDPFPGNVIPSSRLSAVAVKLLSYYPLPNVQGSAAGENNYNDPNPRRIDFHSHTLRVDHNFTQNQRLSGTFSWSNMQTAWGDYFHNEASGQYRTRAHRGLSFNHVLTLRPNLVMNFNYGATRFVNPNSPKGLPFDLTSLGISGDFLGQLDPESTAFPQITVGGYAGLGTNVLLRDWTNYHTLSQATSWMKGDHGLRVGVEYRITQNNQYNYRNVTPRIDFSTTWTKGPLDNSTAAPIGQGLASLLVGLPTGGNVIRRDSYAEQSELLSLFIHDDWKVTPRLTVNVGLRYEMEIPLTERYDRNIRGFDVSVSNPVEAAAQAKYALKPIPEVPVADFRVRGGLTFLGIGGQPKGYTDRDPNNFGPRLGVAFQLTPKTVIRTGYAVFFENILGASENYDLAQPGFSRQTDIVPSSDSGLTFLATLANPFPNGLLDPVGTAAGLRTNLGQAISFLYPDRKSGYAQRWSLSVQRELPNRVMLEVAYVGNRGTGLRLPEDLNALPAAYLSTSAERDQATVDKLTAKVTNPFYGLPEFVGTSLATTTVARAQLLLPYPHFSGVSTQVNHGYSWYHSMQAQVERRFADGFTLQGSYTWSKYMEAVAKLNPTDLYPHEVVSASDRPHRLVINGIWELPVGQTRRFLSNSPGWLDAILGGWSLQGIYMGQSGPPIGFGNIIFRGKLEDIVLPKSERTVQRWFNTAAGFETDSKKQLANNIRTLPLRYSFLRADGFNNFDLSASKDLKLAERLKLQLRISAQDAFNHAMFGAPSTSPTSLLFGSVSSSVAETQRRILISARLSW